MTDSNPARVCIIVLCGLPASGKSTCARRLLRVAEGRPGGEEGGVGDAASCSPPGIHLSPSGSKPGPISADRVSGVCDGLCFIHVAYDDILTTDVEQELLTEKQEEEFNSNTDQEISDWKLYRREIIKCVEHHIIRNRETFPAQGPQTPDGDIWNKFCDLLYQKGVKDHGKNMRTVYVIDDNMYYRSMRYEYYQLARKYGAGYAQLYFDVPVDVSLKRNSVRLPAVKPEVICNMAAKLQPPGVSDPVDKYTLIMSVNDGDEKLPEIIDLLERAFADPVPPVEVEDVEQIEASRTVCSTNLIHQADQILRRLVAHSMAAAKVTGQSKCEMRSLAAAGNARRQLILDNMRSGHILVDTQLNESDARTKEDSGLYEFVKRLYDEQPS